jgi:phage shock protein C
METPKKLYRSRKNKVLAGVCGGIAEYFSQDPTIIRILWVILGLGMGVGILAYVIAWVLIPINPSE